MDHMACHHGPRLCRHRLDHCDATARTATGGTQLAARLGAGGARRLWCRVVLPAWTDRAGTIDVCISTDAVPARHHPCRPVARALLRDPWPRRYRADRHRLAPVRALAALVDGRGRERHLDRRRHLARQERRVAMSGANEIIHQGMRLKIMAALNTIASKKGAIEFTRLKALVGATDGNLGAHLETLEKAGYIVIEKRFEERKPQTRVRMSPAGRRAFAEHVAYLREILDGAGD